MIFIPILSVIYKRRVWCNWEKYFENDLKNKLRAIKKQLIEKHGVGTKFYSGSMFLTFDTLGLYEDKYTGIGGTMDLVVVSPKGKVYLYDFNIYMYELFSWSTNITSYFYCFNYLS